MKINNMDYEKLYKEAIARIRKYTKDEYGCTRLKPEDIFPELAKSEDVMIKEKIIATIHLYYGEPLEDEAKEMIAWLEKKGEQKPADKVEPKFEIEEGKWYVCIRDLLDNYANKAFRKGDIYLSTQNGSLIPSNSNVPFEVVCPDTYFKDWTIQDAKDGDVLSWDDSKCITIFKNIYDEDSFNSYGFVGGCTGTFESRMSYHDIEGAHPATKEQCDTLEKAMAEAGYTFDFEKNELKKVEQNSAWSEEDEKQARQIKRIVHNDGCTQKLQRQIADWLESVKERVGCEVGCTTTKEWREEDECCINQLIVFCENCMVQDCNTKKCANWLKHLKDRVLPQPKQEWSEEDESHIRYLIECLEHCKKGVALTMTTSTAQEYINWLKSLRPQSHWKPTDEQIKVLNEVINFAADHGTMRWNDYIYNVLKSLREQLKNL